MSGNQNIIIVEDLEEDVDIVGTDGNDKIFVDNILGNVTIDSCDGNDKIFINSVTGDLEIDSGDGNDKIFINDVTGDIEIETGDGNDKVKIINVDGNVMVDTGDGNDWVLMDWITGDVNLDLGTGNDKGLLFGIMGNVDVYGDSGRDKILIFDVSPTEVSGPVTVNVDAGGDKDLVLLKWIDGDANVDGGAGRDTIITWKVTGTANTFGGDGNDIILSLFSTDVAEGGSGNDRLILNGGDDTGIYRLANNLNNGYGKDLYLGGHGTDLLVIDLNNIDPLDFGFNTLQEYKQAIEHFFNANAPGVVDFRDLPVGAFDLKVKSFEAIDVQIGVVNNPPVAVDDNFITDENVPVNGVTANVLDDNGNGPDFDPDPGDMLEVVAFDAVSAFGADVSIDSTGVLLYDPTVSLTLQALEDGEFVDDTFTYTITDNNGGFDSATVTVRVNGVGQTLIGTPNPDILTGGTDPDFIDGQGGNDTITGGLGDDILLGGSGDDLFLVAGGDGSDSIDGGLDLDTVALDPSDNSATVQTNVNGFDLTSAGVNTSAVNVESLDIAPALAGDVSVQLDLNDASSSLQTLNVATQVPATDTAMLDLSNNNSTTISLAASTDTVTNDNNSASVDTSGFDEFMVGDGTQTLNVDRTVDSTIMYEGTAVSGNTAVVNILDESEGTLALEAMPGANLDSLTLDFGAAVNPLAQTIEVDIENSVATRLDNATAIEYGLIASLTGLLPFIINSIGSTASLSLLSNVNNPLALLFSATGTSIVDSVTLEGVVAEAFDNYIIGDGDTNAIFDTSGAFDLQFNGTAAGNDVALMIEDEADGTITLDAGVGANVDSLEVTFDQATNPISKTIEADFVNESLTRLDNATAIEYGLIAALIPAAIIVNNLIANGVFSAVNNPANALSAIFLSGGTLISDEVTLDSFNAVNFDNYEFNDGDVNASFDTSGVFNLLFNGTIATDNDVSLTIEDEAEGTITLDAGVGANVDSLEVTFDQATNPISKTIEADFVNESLTRLDNATAIEYGLIASLISAAIIVNNLIVDGVFSAVNNPLNALSAFFLNTGTLISDEVTLDSFNAIGFDNYAFNDGAVNAEVDTTGDFNLTFEGAAVSGNAVDVNLLANADGTTTLDAMAGANVESLNIGFDQATNPASDTVELDLAAGTATRLDNDSTVDYGNVSPQLAGIPTITNNNIVDGVISVATSFNAHLIDLQNGLITDQVSGNSANLAGFDNAAGGSGNDTLIGNDNDNVLTGNEGNDTYTGNLGDDSFVFFSTANGADTITDFVAGSGTPDKIDLTDFNTNLTNVLDNTIDDGFGNTVIDLNALGGDLGDSITLNGVLKADLDADDFIGVTVAPKLLAVAYREVNGAAGSGFDFGIDTLYVAIEDVNGNDAIDIGTDKLILGAFEPNDNIDTTMGVGEDVPRAGGQVEFTIEFVSFTLGSDIRIRFDSNGSSEDTTLDFNTGASVESVSTNNGNSGNIFSEVISDRKIGGFFDRDELDDFFPTSPLLTNMQDIEVSGAPAANTDDQWLDIWFDPVLGI